MAEDKKVDEKKDDKQEEAEKETPKKEEKVDKITELEKKVGEFGDYIGRTKEFIDGASVVIQTIAGDPDLTKRFQETVKKTYRLGGEKSDKQEGEDKDKGSDADKSTTKVEATIRDVASSQQAKIVQDFERSHGIDKMKNEDRKETRGKIAEVLNDFGLKINTIPLAQLEKNLERAYTAAHAEKLKEEGKLEGFIQARGNDLATMSSISGGTPESGSDEGELTEKQKMWAKKLGVNPEKAKKTYLARDEEQTRVSKAESKKK